jgi:hypothetical protein
MRVAGKLLCGFHAFGCLLLSRVLTSLAGKNLLPVFHDFCFEVLVKHRSRKFDVRGRNMRLSHDSKDMIGQWRNFASVGLRQFLFVIVGTLRDELVNLKDGLDL